MREQIKELCFFMICGQTLLYFQSGKKYEKICRMILELLVLAGIVGMILNFLQSIGLRKGEMQALGGAVAGMQRSIEEALNRQLDMEGLEEEFMPGISAESFVEKYTMEEIRVQYQYFAKQYGFEMVKVEQTDDKLQVYLRETVAVEETSETAEISEKEEMTEIAGIQQIEIERIVPGKERRTEVEDQETNGEEADQKGEVQEKIPADEKRLETFRRQLALVFAMEEEKLEVILID